MDRIIILLRSNPCLTGCAYCNEALDIRKGLKDFFHFDSYRLYDGESVQESAAQAAVDNKSLLAVFPTGGGKSITFQVPALTSGRNQKGLTVVISPLQSLMKDQVNNLENKNITKVVTINGPLDPLERADAYERVENGSASLLYISPESLRSKSIERLLLVLKFSKEMSGKIEAQKERNYLPKTAKVRFIVYWQKEDTDTEIRIILPELYFERIGLAGGFKERECVV